MKQFDLVILGGGESGVGCALLAIANGYSVLLSDAGMLKPKYAQELREAGIYWEQGGHTEEWILGAKEVIKSPGIPHKSEIVKKIAASGIPILSELDFAQRYSKAYTIAITGTNGKTTTTSMVYDLLKNANFNVALGGNIGISYARQVAIKDPEYMVLEVSSFQLDDCKSFKPNIAVLTNITPDHLDRYNYNYTEYIQAKFKIGQNMDENGFFIYCEDDKDTKEFLSFLPKNVNKEPFSYYKTLDHGASIQNELMTLYDTNRKIYMTMNIQNFALRGIHNAYNSMAAAVVGSSLGIKKETIRESLANFTNVEHRLEFVAKVGGVEYINDSKATNVNAAWYALESMQQPVIWIAGGVDKGNDYELLADLVKDKVKMIVCLGVDNSKIHQAFGKHVDLILNTMSAEEAVKTAHRFANNGDVVLLSPACASFDLFLNYQERGSLFKQAVANL
jgi:UDP-N-acetylmuramoylalanine--D-glutamate ligase